MGALVQSREESALRWGVEAPVGPREPLMGKSWRRGACRHYVLIDVSKYPDATEVPWFAGKVVGGAGSAY